MTLKINKKYYTRKPHNKDTYQGTYIFCLVTKLAQFKTRC
jgi:hypothetical protein